MKQNILFITADQFRHDALGHRGVFPVTTPHLDALTAGGTAFDQAYTPYPMCVPARASIMTGRHCFHHGVYYNDQGWNDKMPTIPSVLSANGYYTLEVGKTHFFPPGRHSGFDKMILPSAHKNYLDKKYPDRKSRKVAETESWDEMVVRHLGQKWNGQIAPEDYEPSYLATRTIAELEKLVRDENASGRLTSRSFSGSRCSNRTLLVIRRRLMERCIAPKSCRHRSNRRKKQLHLLRRCAKPPRVGWL